jgi:NADH:ubiquinone oxidoreductase subunit 6 (subunit J)
MFASLIALVAAEFSRAVTRRVTYAATLFVAAILLLFAFAFCLVALRDWIEMSFSTREADLMVAVALLIVAGLLTTFGVIRKNRRRPQTLLPSATMAIAPTAIRMAGKSITPRLIAIGSVVLAGIWLGRRARSS